MNDRCVIGLTGDIMIGRVVNEILQDNPPSYIWGDLLTELQQNDLNLMNLEAALTHHPEEVPKVFNFKSDPKNVQCLLEASCDVVNLANNHVLDFTEKGLYDTLDSLDQAGILHVGAGRNEEEAKKPVIVERNGIRIGILGCTDNEPDWKASPDSCGTRYLPISNKSADQLAKEIKALKAKTDIVILTIHWGPNMMETPPRHFIQFAHRMIDAGVSIFHGHSAHIFQGVERVGKSVILYDTGDFVDDYYVDPLLRNDRSFLFRITVDKTGVQSVELIPVLIHNCRVNKSTGEDQQETMRRMMSLSKDFGTTIKDRFIY